MNFRCLVERGDIPASTLLPGIPSPSGNALLHSCGPAYLVGVGYMDPGSWATDLAGGSKFGYTLIWVLLMSNIMALLLAKSFCKTGDRKGDATWHKLTGKPTRNLSILFYTSWLKLPLLPPILLKCWVWQ